MLECEKNIDLYDIRYARAVNKLFDIVTDNKVKIIPHTLTVTNNGRKPTIYVEVEKSNNSELKVPDETVECTDLGNNRIGLNILSK